LDYLLHNRDHTLEEKAGEVAVFEGVATDLPDGLAVKV
jgi:hypothetical protein